MTSFPEVTPHLAGPCSLPDEERSGTGIAVQDFPQVECPSCYGTNSVSSDSTINPNVVKA